MIVMAVAAIGGVVALAVLTGLGARCRGTSVVLAGVAAVFFPVTWVAWYVRDEVPHRTLPAARR
ncbi:hypothetical protein GCM10025786_13420 [Nocardioides caeni]